MLHKNLENMHNKRTIASRIDAVTQLFKLKSLMTWSISEGRVDQKQIINFVWPKLGRKYM